MNYDFYKDNNLKEFSFKFLQLKNKGWIKIEKNGYGAIGEQFERLMGISKNELPFPDFLGYEIKTKKMFGSKYLSLFSLTPESDLPNTVEYLVKNYGYPDKDYKNFKVFHNEIYANRENFVSNKFYMKLIFANSYKTNTPHNDRINLVIKNKNLEIIDSRIYWDIYDIKKIINNKLNKLIIVYYYEKTINNESFFHLYKSEVFIFKNFKCFVENLNKGNIIVKIKIGIDKNKDNLGKIHNHGITFEINRFEIEKVYKKIAVIK